MSISRTCWSCGNPLPEDVSEATCPSCGIAQAHNETPKASGTPADREGDFVLASPNDLTASLHPERELASTVVAEPPAPGRTFRRHAPPVIAGYREVDYLDGGGMGDVYRGIQTGTERRVAIKVMRQTMSSFSQNRERFETEIRALARVDHPGVVRVYECGECAQGPYFSMEFVDGETLSQRVKRDGTLDPHEAARIVRHAAEAVHGAHGVDVLHRDIKPGNIMLATDGTVKVTDFGLAKYTGDEATTDELTLTGVVIGTPSYLPPEQANGDAAALGPTADVYGLGGTLYHLLTGVPPHAARTPARSLRQAQFGDVVPARDRRPELCPILNAIVEKSLAPDPADRYASAELFAVDLKNWSVGEPTLAVPPNRWQRVGRRIRRHRVAVLVLAMFALVGGMAVAARHQLDEKGRLERALARGETVTLVGETGLPKWHDWAVIPARLKGSLLNDGTAGFEANPCAGLVLVEDPQTDHYRFRAEIRHEGGLHSVPGGLTRNDAGKVGLFWGAQKLTAADAAAHLLFTIDFNDLPWKTVQNPDADDYGHKVGFHMNCQFQEPGRYLDNKEVGNSEIHKFPYLKSLPPGEWRTIELVIRPTGCTARWKKIADGSFVDLGHFDAARMDAYLRSRLNLVSALPPGNRTWSPLAAWSPRQPLGIYSYNSNVAVRNATLEPLAPSP